MNIFTRASLAADWHSRQRSAGWEVYSMLLELSNRLRLAAIPAGSCAQCGGTVPPTELVTVYASDPSRREIRWASVSSCDEHLYAAPLTRKGIL